MLKKLLEFGALLPLLFIRPAFADLMPCPTGTLASYKNTVVSCTIGDKTFSNFSYVQGGSGIAEGFVTVTPDTTSGNPGFTFSTANPPWSATAMPGLIGIGYQVSVNSGGNLIDDATLTLPQAPTIANDGSALVIEGICLSAPFNLPFVMGVMSDFTSCARNGGTFTSLALSDVVPAPLTITTTFDPRQFLGVATVIDLSEGTMGAAELMSVKENFSETPEPSSLLICLVGLSGVLSLKRNLRQRR
jgi:hypothetical protein